MTSHSAAKKQKLRWTLRQLQRMYARAKPLKISRGAALDTLIEAMLSQNTNMLNARRGYRMLRRRFPSWTQVMNAPVDDVQREIAICGLARMRARRLQNLLKIIKGRHGSLSLDFLSKQTPEEAFDYLLGFFGIGPKTAAFTLLFGLGHPVLPVDNGVLRVLRRLRLVRPKARDLEAERTLSPLIPRGSHHPLHVLLFKHAKDRCRPKNPRCDDCRLVDHCPHGQRILKHRPPEKDVGLVELKQRPKRLANYISAGVRKRDDPDD